MGDLAANPRIDRLERVHRSCRHCDYQIRRSRDHIEARDLPVTRLTITDLGRQVLAG
jgi:hypothetical protein